MFQFLKDQFETVAQKVRTTQQQTNATKVQLLQLERKDGVFQSNIYFKYLKHKVIQTLNQFTGKKVLVLDKFVADMLNIVVESVNILKENGVEEIYFIDSDILDVGVNQIIFFVRPERELMKRIVRIIRNNQLQQLQKKYMLIFCPRSNIICKDYLEKEAVLGNLILRNFNFDLIPVGSDILSLEVNNCITQSFLQNDWTLLHLVAESIQRMQLIHGKFFNIYAKGNLAKNVIEILKQKEIQGQSIDEENGFKQSKLACLLIVDRGVDLITPMLTPFTYEALIDEYFKIKQNQIDLDKVKEQSKAKSMKLTDQIFHQVKIMNIKQVAVYLDEKRQQNKLILQQKDIKRSTEEMTEYLSKVRVIQKEHNFVLDHYILSGYMSKEIESIMFNIYMNQQVNTLLQTKQHQVEQTIETLIQMGEPFTKVLRLMILYCQIHNGIKAKLYDQYRREILHVYGIEHILTLDNCEKMGLIGIRLGESSVWEKVAKPLRLINEDVDHDQPQDFSYVYLAYAPILVRLLEELIVRNNWNGILQAVKDLAGETVMQQNLHQLSGENVDVSEQQDMCYVIYFIGGVTYGEMAAIRWLSLRYNREIVICTTHITGGDELVQDMVSMEKQ